MIRQTNAEKAFNWFNGALLTLIALVMLFPMWHAICVSLSSGAQTLKGGLFLWPREMNWTAYRMVVAQPSFLGAYQNTIAYTAGGVAFVLCFSALTAYPLAVRGFCLKKFATVMLTITMFVSGGMIPTYMLIKSLSLINTYLVMVLPGCVSCYNVILFRTFFQANAMDLREAAIIDGAGELRVLIRIVAPLSKPIFATLGLFTAVGKWNGWYDALIYLNNQDKYPVQMILRQLLFQVSMATANVDEMTAQMFKTSAVTPQNVQMAAVIFVAAPILCIYPFVQKYFVKGAFVGSLKG